MTNEQVQKVFHKAVAMCDESGFHSPILIQHYVFKFIKNALLVEKINEKSFLEEI